MQATTPHIPVLCVACLSTRFRPCDCTGIFHRPERASFREILRLRGYRSGKFHAWFHSTAPGVAQICSRQTPRTKRHFLRPFDTPATSSILLRCSLLFTTRGTRRCLPDAARWWLSCIGQFFHLSSALGCRVSDYSR